MGSSSIPSSKPVTGRTSTPWLNKSRRSNSSSARLRRRGRRGGPRVWPSGFRCSDASLLCSGSGVVNVERATFDSQRRVAPVLERWRLCVKRGAFFSSRRVKGVWWPSRSSKPLSVGNGRGRFDSYPLRLPAVAAQSAGRWVPGVSREEVNRSVARAGT